MAAALKIAGAYGIASLTGIAAAYLMISLMLIADFAGTLSELGSRLAIGLLAFLTGLLPLFVIGCAPFTALFLLMCHFARHFPRNAFLLAGAATPSAGAATLSLVNGHGFPDGFFALDMVPLVGLFGLLPGILAGYVFWRLGFKSPTRPTEVAHP